ncbi:NAD(P)H-binding protein [Rhodococcus erythropolis]|uniref:NAD(P)H-binding protein n=1 Tax=Rhodococcus erythropolis TaxID=1833 RepID=A0AAX3V6C1_RHOER|nr:MULTISPECIES: NAD(P)H-binding protein [Rhodococcus]MCJ0945915.1 NAD(P)H-binding protein [Rhodococcus sp. ARC_M8]MDN3458639.1 NAD(P)H-binding protein [Rhodococcus sp. APC 3903]MQP36165.1 NAD(P)H-binding protein [Rhodococcus erythropolis]QEX09256.1 NAD(P)H-binding protein [Rhodococcus erythropolis]ULD44291.1 NAD(P)H-binding protein [Rhodococcus qingshengii]
MTTTSDIQSAVVIGGTGKTGARVAQRLTAVGIRTRIASRTSGTRFDWNDQTTWQPAMSGVEAAYVTYAPDLAVPESSTHIEELAELAYREGVRRMVLLSGRGEPAAQKAEQVLADTGLKWAVVRASWFAQNFSEGYLLDPIREGHLALPVGEVGEPFIDVDDLADVAVAALTRTDLLGRVLEVTGPELLTFAEAVEAISAASGRAVSFERIGLQQFSDGMAEVGVPSDVVELLTYLFAEVLDGRNQSVTGVVEEVLERPARDFTTFAAEAARTGVWS